MPSFGWDFDASVEANDRSTHLPGLRAVRGIEVLSEPGVRTLAEWRQSSWPALPAPRTASAAASARLCEQWRSVRNRYNSYPTMLGCASHPAREPEAACDNQAAVVEIACASVDFADPDVANTGGGTIYDAGRWFRLTHSTRPPEPCRATRRERLGRVAIASSAYPAFTGHFVPYLLASLLALHTVVPYPVPLLVVDGNAPRHFLQPLLFSGVIPAKRVLFRSMASLQGSVLQADSVFTLVNSHFSSVLAGDLTLRIAQRALAPPPPAGRQRRPALTILLVEREGRASTARRLANVDGVFDALSSAANEAGAGPWGRQLRVRRWMPGTATAMHDGTIFRNAAVIVGVHGAGLANMLFAREGAAVVEICYVGTNGTMPCPAMYAGMAAHLRLPYWVTAGRGAYAKPITADLAELRATVDAAIAAVKERGDQAQHPLVTCPHTRSATVREREPRAKANAARAVRREPDDVGSPGPGGRIGVDVDNLVP